MTDQELEKLFKSKLGQREVPFNPANWAAMEATLNAEAQRGGAFFWRSAAAILGFGLLAALALFFRPPGQEMVAPAISPQQENFVGQSATPENAGELPQQGQQAGEEVTSDLNQSEQVQTQKPSGTYPSSLGASELTPAPTQGNIATRNRAVESDLKGSASRLPASSSQASEQRLVNSSPLANEAVIAAEVEVMALKSLMLPLTGWWLRSADLNLRSNLGDLPDRHELPPALRRRSDRHQFYLQGGSLLSTSYGDRRPALGAEIGLAYDFDLGQGIGLSTGLHLVRQRQLGIVETTDSTFYDFGKEHIHSVRTTEFFDRLEIPLSLRYNFLGAHQFSVTAYSSVLLQVQESRYREHSTMKADPVVSQERVSGLPDYYNRWNFGLGVAYHYRLSERFQLGLALRKDLSDFTLDLSPALQPTHQNFSARLQLRYQLFNL